jgi:hypothetical protein
MQGDEQLSLERLVTVSTDDFEENLKHWKYSFLSAHSGIGPSVMLKELAKNRSSKLFDERRSSGLSDEERRKKDHFLAMVEHAKEYRKWVEENDFQPLIRDLFLSQCVGFENCLKTLAVASHFCQSDGAQWERIVYVPSTEFNRAHKRINEVWQDKNKHESERLQYFFSTYFLNCQLVRDKFSGLSHFDAEKWIPVWREIYRLRNAVAHSRARPIEQLVIGDEIFQPSEEARLTEFTLTYVGNAFQELINCFRLSMDDL